MLFDLFGPLLGPLLIVIMVIVVFESCWRKCPPDKLMIVSGFGQTRSVSGKGTFVIPGLQRVDTLALGAVQVQLSTENEIPTQDAILIHACAVANFQIGQVAKQQAAYTPKHLAGTDTAQPGSLAQTGDRAGLIGETFVIGGTVLVAAGVFLDQKKRREQM